MIYLVSIKLASCLSRSIPIWCFSSARLPASHFKFHLCTTSSLFFVTMFQLIYPAFFSYPVPSGFVFHLVDLQILANSSKTGNRIHTQDYTNIIKTFVKYIFICSFSHVLLTPQYCVPWHRIFLPLTTFRIFILPQIFTSFKVRQSCVSINNVSHPLTATRTSTELFHLVEWLATGTMPQRWLLCL